jgi:uncharacterized protein YjbI with pentapeptide repeats
VDAIKTGLGIAAGTTGVFALLLSVRRQWHTEADAIEKNVTELYTKAADQLGSDQAPVRMAGLYALERLAHGNPLQRQSIINVICAYLRMPYTLPDDQPPDADTDGAEVLRAEHRERTQEREVRLAAQRILTDHLKPNRPEAFWADIDLDLSNAHLIDFNLEFAQTGDARFGRATFSGAASFEHTTFSGGLWFDHATFSDTASFDYVTFPGVVWFDHVTFSEVAGFAHVTFPGVVSFNYVTFSDVAWFDHATFSDLASFDYATFPGVVSFEHATFFSVVRFASVTFSSAPGFDHVTFDGVVSFRGATADGTPFTFTPVRVAEASS